jgi:hypothetical protein
MATADPQTLIVFLFGAAAIMSLVATVAAGLLIWFRKPVFDSIKLKKLIKFGYIKAELIRHDRTRLRCVLIPKEKENGVRFPGVEGLYILDDASVLLDDRKYPTYVWQEGETAPINFGKEHVSSPVKCPKCTEQFTVNMSIPKSIAPSVLDNLIMKIKTIAAMVGMNQMLMYLLIGTGLAILAGVAATVIGNTVVNSLDPKNIATTFAPIIDICKAQCTDGITRLCKP